MTPTAVLCGLLAGAAVLVWGGGRSGQAGARLVALLAPSSGRTGPSPDGPAGRRGGARRTASLRTGHAIAGTLMLSGLALVAEGGGDPVLVAAVLASGGAVAFFSWRRPAEAARRERAVVAAALPATADLLATCLSSGAAPVEALRTVAESTTGPLAGRIRQVAGALQLGADPVEAWGPVEAGDPVASLARAFIRSNATGAPIAATVAAVADDQRRARRWAAEAAARRAGVLAVGPLAACFLPAFLLIGVVPVILAVAGEVLDGLR